MDNATGSLCLTAAGNAVHLSDQAQVGLDRFKAAFAATQHLSIEELRLHRQPRLSLRRAPKPRPRDKEPPPLPSRQFQPATSALVLRDRRLTHSAARLAGWIVTLAGQRGHITTTRARLGAALGLRPRTITRALGDLQRHGYVLAQIARDRIGAHSGLIIFVLPRLMPFYLIEKKAWPRGASRVRDPINPGVQDDLHLPQDVPRRPPDREKG